MSSRMSSSNGGAFRHAGGADDWVEIHNLGASLVNLADIILTDRLNNPTKCGSPSTPVIRLLLHQMAMWSCGQMKRGIKDGTTQIFD